MLAIYKVKDCGIMKGMIRTGKKFSKAERSRVINGDKTAKNAVLAGKKARRVQEKLEKKLRNSSAQEGLEKDQELQSQEIQRDFEAKNLVKIGEFEEKLAEKPEKVRLDVLMGEIFKSYNRSTLQKFIEFGFVSVDGELAKKANQRVERGVKIELKVPETMKNADLVPEVIYEDENVVVLDKPAGLLSMAKGEYCPENTLERYGLLVHRLDRDTSGVVIMAKNEEVQRFLKKQFQARTTHKTYYAVVSGRPKLDEARIDLPIIRDLKRPTTFRVEAGGKPSETFYRVIKSNGEHSLIELRPTTGRTHQLRVHMKYIGTPIVGDIVYGIEKAKRMYLHAGKLEVTLPGGVRKVFESEIPSDFFGFFQKNEKIEKNQENSAKNPKNQENLRNREDTEKTVKNDQNGQEFTEKEQN